jgi:hypothetical protein
MRAILTTATSKTHNASARVLQSAWRKVSDRTQSIVARLVGTGFMDAVRNENFDDLMVFIRGKGVIDAVKSCVERICAMSHAVHGAAVVRLHHSHRRNSGSFTSRVFLTIYLVRYHPTNVFWCVKDCELELVRLAGQLVDDFDEMVSLIQAHKRSFMCVPAGLALRFTSNIGRYIQLFSEWEQNYRQPTLDKLCSCLVSLYFSYFNHPRENTSVRGAVVEQIEKLRVRTQECYGVSVMNGIDDDFRRGKHGLPPFDPLHFETLDLKFFVVGQLDQFQLVQDILLDINHNSTEETRAWVPMLAYMAAGNNDIGLRSGEVMLGLISSPPVFAGCVSFFGDCLTRVLAFAPGYLHEWIRSSMIPGSVRSMEGCVAFLNTLREVMHKIEMPASRKKHEDEWEALGTVVLEPESIVGALLVIHRAIRLSELDYYNVRILKGSQTMYTNGVYYIENQYQELLQGGTITMERTTAWVSAAFRATMESKVIAPSELRPLTTTMGIIKVLFTGFDFLVFGDRLQNNECDFPETLLLDVWRLCALQRKMRVDAVAVMLLCGLGEMLVDWPAKGVVFKKVTKVLLELRYGVRGIDDDCLVCKCGQGLAARIKEEIVPMLEEEGHAVRFAELLRQCLDMRSEGFQSM